MELNLEVVRLSDDVKLPTKAHDTDAGYDISIIGVAKIYSDRCKLYHTGLKIAPPPGYYTELVARSSLMKYGFMLSNGVGVIDQGYLGELMVGLYKFDETAPDLEFPFSVAQLIPRQMHHLQVVKVEKLRETDRGEGGFGSTREGGT
jgi:dUTP pyrophosphatase